jgi:hypothetical protein
MTIPLESAGTVQFELIALHKTLALVGEADD